MKGVGSTASSIVCRVVVGIVVLDLLLAWFRRLMWVRFVLTCGRGRLHSAYQLCASRDPHGNPCFPFCDKTHALCVAYIEVKESAHAARNSLSNRDRFDPTGALALTKREAVWFGGASVSCMMSVDRWLNNHSYRHNPLSLVSKACFAPPPMSFLGKMQSQWLYHTRGSHVRESKTPLL